MERQGIVSALSTRAGVSLSSELSQRGLLRLRSPPRRAEYLDDQYSLVFRIS